MRAAGWLKFAPLLAGQTTYLWLTGAGIRQVYLAYAGWEPGETKTVRLVRTGGTGGTDGADEDAG